MPKISHDEQMRLDSELLAKRAMQIHRGGARAAVLGVNDGLVSTLCIVLAVAAATSDAKTVITAGFAGLIAGAISMAAGEWISVTSQVDLFRGVLDDLKHLAKHDKEVLVTQLQTHNEEIGMDPTTAEKAANEVSRDDNHLMVEYAENVMGFNPEELGSPWTAAFSSFALFTAGSLTALFPWFFWDGYTASVASVISTIIGGLIVGGYVSNSGGSSIPRGAMRQLLIIVFAAVVTYGVGHLFGSVAL